MVFWVDSTGTGLINIPFFLIIKLFSFLECLERMIYTTCFTIMFIVADDDYFFFHFPVKIWVASLVIYAFRGSTILQFNRCIRSAFGEAASPEQCMRARKDSLLGKFRSHLKFLSFTSLCQMRLT